MVVFTASLVATARELRDFLGSITPRCTLYVDIDGENLSRYGSISLITILVHQLQEIHIIDVLSLGYVAFTTVSDSGTTLKSVLEDPTITKCFWDVRNDADALWSHFEVSLAGVMDIQLLENASRQTGHDKEFLCERDKAIRMDLSPIVGLTNVSRDNSRPGSTWMPLRSKGDGDSTPICSRPLDKETVLACTRGVLHLRGLRDVYMRRISIAWLAKVRFESAKRVIEAQSVDYEPQSPMKIKGPWKARLGTVGIAPAMFERKTLDRSADGNPGRGLLKVSTLETTNKDVHNAEKKRSRLFRWKDAATYQQPPPPKYQDIDNTSTADWWD